MAKRLLTAVIGIPLLLVVLFFENIYLLEGCVTVLTLAAMFELYRATGVLKHKVISIIGAVCGIVIIFFQFSGTSSFFGLLLIFVVALFLTLIIDGGRKLKFEQVAIVFVIALFVPIFFSQIVRVRMLENGNYLIYLIFIASFVSDAFAYFVGRKIGRHKFAPRVSPKKTIEGAVAGVVGGVIGFLIFGVIMQFVCGFTVDYPLLILYGVLGAVISEIGDLAASVIKREFGVKDYGNIMPGHGGVMDRFDSVLFVAPLLSLLLYNYPILF